MNFIVIFLSLNFEVLCKRDVRSRDETETFEKNASRPSRDRNVRDRDYNPANDLAVHDVIGWPRSGERPALFWSTYLVSMVMVSVHVVHWQPTGRIVAQAGQFGPKVSNHSSH